MKLLKHSILFIIFIIYSHLSFAQDGVVYGNKATDAPEDCAELEIYSTTKGFLMPSVSDFSDITAPVQGLLVYNSTLNVYGYYTGATWITLPLGNSTSLIHDEDEDTKVEAVNMAGTDSILFEVKGERAMQITNDLNLAHDTMRLMINDSSVAGKQETNLLFGKNAGNRTMTGQGNIFLGNNSGRNITTGSTNIAIGNKSLFNLTATTDNIALGFQSGKTHTGFNSVYIGAYSGSESTNTENNVYIGYEAGQKSLTGKTNIALGYQTGLNTTGDNNILIGAKTEAQPTNTDNYINVGNLITADQSIGSVTFSTTTNPILFPSTAGLAGQALVLGSDGSTLEWKDVPKTVITGLEGASADLMPFDLGDVKTNSYLTTSEQHAVKIETFQTVSISRMTTKTRNNGIATICMGVYNENKELMGKGCISSTSNSGYVTVDLTAEAGQELVLEEYKNYYLSFLSSSSTELYQSNTSDLTTLKSTTSPASLESDISSFTETTGSSFWIRAY